MIPSPVEFPISERGREGWGEGVVWVWILSGSTQCCLFILFVYLFLQAAAREPIDSNLWCRDK